MQTHTLFLFAAGAILLACSDPSGTDQVSGPGQVIVVTSTTGAIDTVGYQVVVDSVDSHTIGSTDTWQLSVEPGRHTVTLRGIPDHCAVTPGASLAIDVPSDSSVQVRFDVRCALTTGVVQIAVTPVGPDLSGESYSISIDGELEQPVTLYQPSSVTLPVGDHVVSIQRSEHCDVVGPDAAIISVTNNPLDTLQLVFPVTCIVPAEKAGTVRITLRVTGFPPNGARFPVSYTHGDPWSYPDNFFVLDSLARGKTMDVQLEAGSVDPEHALYWFRVEKVKWCPVSNEGPAEVPLGDTLFVVLSVECPSPWDY